MIERAIILKIQKEQPNVQLFIKLILMINRIYYPQMIAITVFSSTLLLFLNVSMQILLERYAYSEISGTSILI